MGSYTNNAGSLTIEVGPMTMAACPPDSRSDQFVLLLGSAVRYYFEDDQLYIDLEADGGSMAFAPADDAAMTGALPAELVAQLDAYLQSQVWTEGGDPEGAAPGLVLLVDTPEGRYLSAAGVSSLEEMTPMQADDILEIGSNTKSMTVVLLMQMQEEGILSLDDMLSDWLPDLAAKIPNGDEITLRQMAQHTAGLWDYGDPLIGEAATNADKLELGYPPEELVQYAIDNGTPDFAPGEEGKWKYSNTGYVLLGMIAEKASGQGLGELYQERIFDPLGLETAVLIEGVPQEGEITAQGYWWLEDGEVLNTTNWNASQGWAAGAVAMTAEDLAAYGEALAAGDLFQNEDSLGQMLDFDEDALYVVGGSYGLGLIDFDNGYWGHEGQTAGFQTLWYTNPDEQTTVVGLTNSAAYSGFAFLNVLNILEGEGAKPFTAGTLLPVGNLLSSKWAWVQRVETSGTSDIPPGMILTLAKDGTATAKGEGCGVAIGTFTSDASGQISFELDASLITCDDQAPVTQLVGLLGGADTWHFDNGNLVIGLDDGGSLLFEVDKTE
jgi:D-alanyl-D-alanine carboxypeptidase